MWRGTGTDMCMQLHARTHTHTCTLKQPQESAVQGLLGPPHSCLICGPRLLHSSWGGEMKALVASRGSFPGAHSPSQERPASEQEYPGRGSNTVCLCLPRLQERCLSAHCLTRELAWGSCPQSTVSESKQLGCVFPCDPHSTLYTKSTLIPCVLQARVYRRVCFCPVNHKKSPAG